MRDIFFQTDSNGDPAPGEQTGIFSTYDGYITKLNGDNKLDWSTYFGGNFFDDVRTIRMAAGNAYLSGSTGSFEKFPLRGPDTGNYQQNQKIGLVDAFLARLKVGSTPVGVEEKNDTAFPLEAFPNPVTQAVNIAIPKGSWQLRLFSIDGKLVYHTILNMSQPGLKLVDMAHLPAGIYVCQLHATGAGQCYVGKIFKSLK